MLAEDAGLSLLRLAVMLFWQHPKVACLKQRNQVFRQAVAEAAWLRDESLHDPRQRSPSGAWTRRGGQRASSGESAQRLTLPELVGRLQSAQSQARSR